MTKVLLHELGKSVSFGRLSLLGKVLWPMLLAASDDQGRGQAEADVVKWSVCPNVPELTVENIPALLQEMVDQAMLHVYTDGRGRVLYQAVRWWEYQSLQWAQPSRYEAPENWADRVRANRRGIEFLQENWDGRGGFGGWGSPNDYEKSGEDAGENPPANAGENPPEKAPEPTILTQPNSIQPNLTEEEPPPAAKPPPPPPRDKRKQPTAKQQASRAMFTALADSCQIDLKLLSKAQRMQLNQTEKRLREQNITPHDLVEFTTWWYENDWRGKKKSPPKPAQVREEWGKFTTHRKGGQHDTVELATGLGERA